MSKNGEKCILCPESLMIAPITEVDYVGEFSHRLDTRNRVTVPSSWRVPGDEGNYYFAWPHPDGSISVFPPEMLAELREKTRSVKQANSKGRQLLRQIFAKGFKFGCDKQGRILLPKPLLDHAGITKGAWLVGIGRNFEIWSEEKYQPMADESFDMLAAMDELDF